MSNLLVSYRQEVVKELCIIYIKAVLVQEFISIFPIFSQIKLNQDSFIDYFKTIFKTKPKEKSYYQLLIESSKIDEQLIEENIKTSINEIFDILFFENKISFIESFPNSFEKYLSEPSISNPDFPFLDSEKYKSNNIFLEYYFRLNERPSQFATNNESFKYKQVVNANILRDLIQNEYGNFTDEQFFNIFPDIAVGVRLMFNPVIVENRLQLYNDLKNVQKIKEEKINAISGKQSASDNIVYFFPLEICKKEYSLFTGYDNAFVSIDRTKLSVLNFINNNFNDLNNSLTLFQITNKLWKNDEFRKLFLYHIPVQVFELLIPRQHAGMNMFLDKVYKNNLSYDNLYSSIINLIDRVLSTEDPTKL